MTWSPMLELFLCSFGVFQILSAFLGEERVLFCFGMIFGMFSASYISMCQGMGDLERRPCK